MRDNPAYDQLLARLPELELPAEPSQGDAMAGPYTPVPQVAADLSVDRQGQQILYDLAQEPDTAPRKRPAAIPEPRAGRRAEGPGALMAYPATEAQARQMLEGTQHPTNYVIVWCPPCETLRIPLDRFQQFCPHCHNAIPKDAPRRTVQTIGSGR